MAEAEKKRRGPKPRPDHELTPASLKARRSRERRRRREELAALAQPLPIPPLQLPENRQVARDLQSVAETLCERIEAAAAWGWEPAKEMLAGELLRGVPRGIAILHALDGWLENQIDEAHLPNRPPISE